MNNGDMDDSGDDTVQLTLSGEVQDSETACPTCGREFDTEIAMKRHHYSIHGESIADTVTLVCEHCGKEREYTRSTAEKYTSGFCQECLYNEDLGDAHPSSRERPAEVRERIAEARRGHEMPEETKKAVREGWWEWWENEADQEARIEKLIEGIPDERSDEMKQRISKTLQGHEVSEETRQKIRENAVPHSPLTIEVEETGHTVRSNWEEEIDLMLHEAGVEYEYEPEWYDLDGKRYLPDFRVGDTVIEVKGWADDDSIHQAEKFLEQHPDQRYIVVGSEMPADVFIPWENRERLLEVL
jgi:hypothetical protein